MARKHKLARGVFLSYSILYKTKKRGKAQIWRRFCLTLCFFLAFLYCTWSQTVQLRRHVRQAAEEFAQQIQSGQQVGEALSAFCQGILYGE